jgi:hypothetical protein
MGSEGRPPTPAETAARHREEWRRLLAAVDRIPDDLRSAAIDGTWTIKEVIAHVAAWNRELVMGVEELLAGHPPHYENTDEDEFNARVAASVAGASLDDVRRDAHASHAALMEKLTAISPADWLVERATSATDGRPLTLAELFGYRYRGLTHYGGHAVEIEEWLAARS